jgi:hypothetical protein
MDGANSFIRGLFVDGSGTNPENLQILAFSLYLTITKDTSFGLVGQILAWKGDGGMKRKREGARMGRIWDYNPACYHIYPGENLCLPIHIHL